MYLPKKKKPVVGEQKPEKKRRKQVKKTFKFSIGDHVRLSHIRTKFSRGYHANWSSEVFTITDRFVRDSIPLYKVKDYSSELVQGTFYEGELLKAVLDLNAVYKIEKVLKTRTGGGRKESLVRWVGWHSKYDTWLPQKEIKSYSSHVTL